MHLESDKTTLLQWIDQNAPRFTHMADQIWAKPEILWEEFMASDLQARFLEEEGFNLTRDIAGMNTSFIAEWGRGKPVVALIGEYDALPGLSQKMQATKEPLVENGPGHGCGHNLLGTAALAATLAVRKWLQESGRAGTVRYYGCPAEEGGGGKVFMAHAGLFDDLDCALTYHPGNFNTPNKGGTVAIWSARFRFQGVTAHAGGSPHRGRSALDAVELMNVGANYMREHVLDGTRIQYIITDGGRAANIVPETAEVEYVLRAEKPDYLEELVTRLRDIARGAALMTGTTFEEQVQAAYSGMLANHVLADRMYAAMQFIGPIEFTPQEMDFAQKINDAFPGSNPDYIREMVESYKLSPDIEEQIMADSHLPLYGANLPALDANYIEKGATDVGDLSRVTPTGSFITTCFPTGSPGHSWSNVASGGMSIGHKGMLHAAKIMALTALDLFADPAHLEAAQAEFKRKMGSQKYRCPLPETMVPPRLEPWEG